MTTTTKPGAVSVTRLIKAPASRVFAVLADPKRHPSFDGSGMLRDAGDSEPLRAVGDVFLVAMHNDEMGDYEMRNCVVEFEPDRRIVWEPVLSASSRPEDQADVGQRAHHRWGYELEPHGDETELTEFFDCSASPDWLRKVVKDGQRWVPAMESSLDLLDAQFRAAQVI